MDDWDKKNNEGKRKTITLTVYEDIFDGENQSVLDALVESRSSKYDNSDEIEVVSDVLISAILAAADKQFGCGKVDMLLMAPSDKNKKYYSNHEESTDNTNKLEV